MKIQIVYTSLTGCTGKVARAIYDALPQWDRSIHDLRDGAPAPEGDVILLGYWGVGGGPCPEMRDYMTAVKDRAVGVFCTLGYYADSAHGRQTLETGLELLKDRNRILGGFVCNGAVASQLKKGQGKEEGSRPTEQKELRWEMIRNHPTEAECALAAERFRERIRLYERCLELGIPFASIL